MFELLGNTLRVDKPKWLNVCVKGTETAPDIVGGTTVFSNSIIIDTVPSWNWQGLCTSNGGNFDQSEGNVIEIVFNDNDVAQVVAMDSVTGEKETFLLNVPEDMETESSEALFSKDRHTPVAFSVGSEKVSKKYFGPSL